MNFLTAVKNHREREKSVGLRVTGNEIGRVASHARRGEYLMTEAVQKITLLPSRDIPFDKPMLMQSNVQRIKAGVSVEDLAEDIARRGLMQSLSVRPVLADDGTETGKFEIPTGGRRFLALSLLVKQKRLAKTTPIPCIVRGSRFWPRTVPLRKTCSASLCTRSTSCARLCPCLTRVRPMLHDLFQGDGDSSLEDPALLDRLVTEKLQAETVAVEGWKWIEVAVDLPYGYGYSHSLRSLSCDPAHMTDEEEAVHTKRLSEYQALEEEHAGQDETPAEIDKRLRVSEAEMEKIEALPLVFNPTDIRRAGAFVTLDRYGALAVYRGYDHLTSDESIENGITANVYIYAETVQRFG